MRLLRTAPRTRWTCLAILAALLAVATTTSGCSTIIAELSRECIREGYQTVQVCQRYEANGHCAFYGSSTRQVCLERAPREPVNSSPAPSYSPPAQTYSTPTPAPRQTSTSVGQELDAKQLIGTTWRGSYVCAQGQTGARLEIGQAGPDGLRSRFSFYALEQNPTVPSGSFWVDVQLTADLLAITPVAWIERPEEYFMIGANGQLVVEDYGAGEIVQISATIPDAPGCTAMTLELQ